MSDNLADLFNEIIKGIPLGLAILGIPAAIVLGFRLGSKLVNLLAGELSLNAYEERKAKLRSQLSSVSSDDLESELVERQARRLGIEKLKMDEKPKRGRVYIGDDGELLEEYRDAE